MNYHAIVLAAGAGARFGGSKLTAPWQGGVLLDAALRSASAAPVDSVIVVTGAHADAVDQAVSRFGSARPVRCIDHASGMSASIRCGLAALPCDAAGAFIFLGDMPRVPDGLAALLLDRVRAGALAAAPEAGGSLGHPVLITARLFETFAERAGDGGGQIVLRALGTGLATVALDDPIHLADIDTTADLDRLRG